MWASLTKTLTKDLGEFATVLTRDTQRIVEGEDDAAAGIDTGGVVAGDEGSPEGALFRVTQDELVWFQSEVGHVAAPLSPEEEETAARLSMEGRDGAALLASNEMVRDQFAYLVTQSAREPAATPQRIKLPDFLSAVAPAQDDEAEAEAEAAGPQSPAQGSPSLPRPGDEPLSEAEFFRRYFTRLLIFRRKCSAERRRRSAPRSNSADGGVDEDQQRDGDGDWDDEDEPVPAKGAALRTTKPGQLPDAERAQYQRRISELETLVKALSGQVGHLQDENARLASEARHRGNSADSGDHSTTAAEEAGASPAPVPPASTAAGISGGVSAPRATSSHMAIEDDDWATLS
jgi:hypothetical protein